MTYRIKELDELRDDLEEDGCVDCTDGDPPQYEDPRDLPIECGLCLCESCYKDAIEEQINEFEDRAEELKRELAEFKPKPPAKFIEFIHGYCAASGTPRTAKVQVRSRADQQKCGDHNYMTRVDPHAGWVHVCTSCGASAR